MDPSLGTTAFQDGQKNEEQDHVLGSLQEHSSELNQADLEYIHSLADDLHKSVANSSPEVEPVQLYEGGILTTANHRSWYRNVHPVTWVHKIYKSHHFGNYVVCNRTSQKLQHLFLAESLKQGKHFDAPESVSQIPHFVKTYKLDLTDLLEPDIANYGNFNEFFSRKLKPDARLIAEENDPNIITSAADSRLSCFESVTSATEFWIKGQSFTIGRLLQDDALAAQFDDGSLAVFRLAPQDYHRFHSPVQGTIATQPVNIGGTYFTVNPMAVNENLNVFTENVRTVSLINLDQQQDGGNGAGVARNEAFDQCVFVSIGALLVGSIKLTGAAESGNKVNKGDELGYFAYGGSTCILLFKKGAVAFDKDLLANSKMKLETLVRMGEHIGTRC
ncbi:hypothetical protein BGZ98_004644 [Dissophora globulifera]|nr:hypothetical protein BGZ98_004644 [Dissophora globulifera]